MAERIHQIPQGHRHNRIGERRVHHRHQGGGNLVMATVAPTRPLRERHRWGRS
jgi:hypothetical protein